MRDVSEKSDGLDTPADTVDELSVGDSYVFSVVESTEDSAFADDGTMQMTKKTSRAITKAIIKNISLFSFGCKKNIYNLSFL